MSESGEQPFKPSRFVDIYVKMSRPEEYEENFFEKSFNRLENAREIFHKETTLANKDELVIKSGEEEVAKVISAGDKMYVYFINQNPDIDEEKTIWRTFLNPDDENYQKGMIEAKRVKNSKGMKISDIPQSGVDLVFDKERDTNFGIVLSHIMLDLARELKKTTSSV